MDPTKPPVSKVPALPSPDQEDALRGHLFIHHSLYTTEKSKLAELYECHEIEHAEPQWIPHPHTHSAPEKEEEFSWE